LKTFYFDFVLFDTFFLLRFYFLLLTFSRSWNFKTFEWLCAFSGKLKVNPDKVRKSKLNLVFLPTPVAR
jgi:hypothetical protein